MIKASKVKALQTAAEEANTGGCLYKTTNICQGGGREGGGGGKGGREGEKTAAHMANYLPPELINDAEIKLSKRDISGWKEILQFALELKTVKRHHLLKRKTKKSFVNVGGQKKLMQNH